jgi:origin recognition complex subunit 4
MERSRSTKRRKVNGTNMKETEEESLIQIDSPTNGVVGNMNGNTTLMDIDEDALAAVTTPTKTSSRRKSSGRQPGNANDALEDGANGGNNIAGKITPSVRSSGRQRKAPQRLEDVMPEMKRTRSAGKAASIPSKKASSDETPRHALIQDDEDTSFPVKSMTPRKRARRQSVRFSTADIENETAINGHTEDIDEDDADEIVNAQLQQDLLQELTNSEDQAISVESLPDYAQKFEKLCESNLCAELSVLSRVILGKLSGKRIMPLKGIDSEYQKVFQLVEQTVTAGEGNSMLVMGSRGCGKTAVIESIVSTLLRDHKDEFHVVRLSGFLHTDDRLALREIWRQLGRETNTEDEAARISSYADTMSTLLALLSHPEELYGSNGSSDAIATAKSVVIILDEFDLFAAHPRQTLLYNLFDIAQARKAPLAVIGVTTKVDVTETLEKRVKSRFSHRYVFLPLPKTLDIFSEICLAALSVDEQELLDSNIADDELNTSSLITPNGRLLLERWREYLQVS